MNVLLEIFGASQIQLLGLVMGLNEIILGIWLLIKGFNSTTNARYSSQ
jgi:hypothetical protein